MQDATSKDTTTSGAPVRRMSGSELLAELDRLRAENAALAMQAKQNGNGHGPGITFKVSAKGAVSAYGLGRFPVTLYGDQWLRLIDKADQIKAFIEEHKASLAAKAVPAGK